jgi:hypothetical protein
MLRIFNSAYYAQTGDERFIDLSEVNIVEQKIDWNGRPYILFEHTDFPLGCLKATYDGTYWGCDLD